MKTKNVELLEKTLEAIKNSPEAHNQEYWINFGSRCGTSMCSAGYAAVMAGAEQPPNNEWYHSHGWTLDSGGKLLKSNEFFDGKGQAVSWFAREKLGFNDDEHDYIFFCMSNKVVLKRIQQLIDIWHSGEEFSYDTHTPIPERN